MLVRLARLGPGPWLVAGCLVVVGLVLPSLPVEAASGEELVEKYPDGKKKAVYALGADGQKNGAFEEFHPDGKRAAKGAYKADKLSGPYQSHFPNGKIKVKASYREGMLNGKYIEHSETGPIARSAEYKDDKLHGANQEFVGGKPVKDEVWIAGELIIPKSAAQIAATLKAIEKSTAKSVGEFPKGLTSAWQAALMDTNMQARRDMALKHLQAYRYLCDVPYEDIVLDRTFTAHCEAGCDIMNRVGELTHTPKNPGMPEDEYQFAYKGTSSSNIYSSSAMIDSITAFMDDSDATNIDRLGHRRWCINPKMLKTGVAGNNGYSAMWSLDQSRDEVPDYQFVAYPPKGVTPVSFFKSSYAWSLSLNPKKYKAPDPTTTKAAIYPCRFNAKQGTIEKAPQPLTLNYSKIDLGGFAIPNCIIFRPADVAVAPGASYWVEVTGLKDADGKDVPLGYLVSFIGM